MRKLTFHGPIVLLALLLLPSVAFAQASLAGVVKDASGAVLPGVTVEAASPALIEKTRTVVTDGSGQYKVVDLRAGTYTVTFTLPGFNTIKREGIELSGNFAASVNVDMKVGAIEETVTVSGETPIVDVQSSRQQAIISKDVLDSIPTGRSHNQIVSLIPGISVAAQDVGGSGGIQTPGSGQIHGSTTQDGRLQSDGLNVGYNGGSANMWMSNAAAAQETIVSTSGGLGEAETGGVVVNVVPKDGGNNFKGTFFVNYAGEGYASSNYTQALKDQGLRAPNTIQKVYDINPMFGGPIVKDRIWFFLTSRTVGAKNYVAGMFVNRNAGTAALSPNFDPTQQAVTDNRYITGTVRLALQANSKNKFSVYVDNQDRCVTCSGGGTATTTIEATSRSHAVPSNVGQVTWQSPVTSRLLLEAGYGLYNQRWGGRPRDDGSYNPQLTNFTEQCTAGCAANGGIAGLSYRQPGSYQHNWTGQQNWRASASYVTGSHSMKVGYLGTYDQPTINTDAPTGFSNFQLNNGTPNRLTQFLETNQATLMKVLSLYAQDQWTRGRMTLQGGVRFDRGVTEFTGGDRADLPTIKAGRWLATPITYSGDDLKGTNYKDITPRAAVSYDLFGNGKTAVKVVIGKYMQALSGGSPLNPLSRTAITATRSWQDNNKDFIPQCDFSVSGATNLLGSKAIDGTKDACGALSNPAFGTNTLNSNYNHDAFNGWGVRPYEWDFSTSIQREILPRISLNVGYYRRWFGNQAVTDNRAVGPQDFDAFSFVAPTDTRLPDGGGYTVSNLYNVTPTKFSSIDNYITLAKDYGKYIQHWNGVDLSVNGRLKSITFQGGTSTGRDSWDNCEVRAQLPELSVNNIGVGSVSPTNPYCSGESKWLTQFKGLVAYTIPKVDVNVAATVQSIPNQVATGQGVGTPGLAANINVTSSQVTGLPNNRAFAGGAANLSVNLVAPGTLYGDRTNQIDFRVAKIFKYGRTRTQVGLDLYNLTNSNAVQTYNQNYVLGTSQWLTPTGILQARFAKISAQFDW